MHTLGAKGNEVFGSNRVEELRDALRKSNEAISRKESAKAESMKLQDNINAATKNGERDESSSATGTGGFNPVFDAPAVAAHAANSGGCRVASRVVAGSALDWAAGNFEGGVRVDEPSGIDPLSLGKLQSFGDWQGPDEVGWKESEVGFANKNNECYMIALVQMLGTARRVRDAIGRLPVPVVGEQSLDARVTKVLRHDFVLKGKPSQAPQLCYSGKHCHLFTEGQRSEKPLELGKQ